MRPLFDFLKGEQAATAVEYAVMLALILLVMIVAISQFGGGTGDLWRGNVTALQAHMPS